MLCKHYEKSDWNDEKITSNKGGKYWKIID